MRNRHDCISVLLCISSSAESVKLTHDDTSDMTHSDIWLTSINVTLITAQKTWILNAVSSV